MSIFSEKRNIYLISGSVIIVIVLFALYLVNGGNIDIISSMTDWLSKFIEEQEEIMMHSETVSWNYLIILAVIMFIQTIIAPIPASVFLIFGGALFWTTYGVEGFIAAVIFAAIGNSLGAFVCYFIGLYGGRPAVKFLISEDTLQQGDKFFEQYGGWAVFIARMFPFAPADPISYLAGINKLKFWPVFFWSIITSSIGLSFVYEGLGVIFKPQVIIDLINAYSMPMTIIFYLIVIIIAVYYLFIKPKNQRSASSAKDISVEKKIDDSELQN